MRPPHRPARLRRSHIGLLGSLVLATAAHKPAVLVAVVALMVLVVLVYLGVIMPAVWFRQPTRRRDARAVLQQLLDALRPSRDL